jgi:hypothetical protein
MPKRALIGLSLLALVVGLAYILVAHPPIAGGVAMIGVPLVLCVLSWRT